MKKPSADERADASRLVTVAGHIALVGEPPCPGGQVGEGVSPDSLCTLQFYGVGFEVSRSFMKKVVQSQRGAHPPHATWSARSRTPTACN